MTECRVEEIPHIPQAHPLATRTGAEALACMVGASYHWNPLSARCKEALLTAYSRALESAEPGQLVPLPMLPEETHPATVKALTRRGLVKHWGMTPLGVEVTRWAGHIGRPVKSVELGGERL